MPKYQKSEDAGRCNSFAHLSRKICLFAALSVLAACGGDDDQSAADIAIPVVVEKVKLGPISEKIASTGTLRPVREERVVARVQGILRMAGSNGGALASGKRVAAGTLLAEIENQEYVLNVRVPSQKLAMENAQRELEKQEALFKEGGVTEKELELARRAALDARLNYEAAELQLKKLELRAPIGGFITNMASGVNGTRVSAGFVLCSIMDYSQVFAEVKLPNTDLSRVAPGQKAIIRNYALPDREFEGRVAGIDPTIDPQTRTFTAKVEIPNPDLVLRPGMFVKIDIIIQNHPQAVVIPKEALQTRNNRPVVFVVQGVTAEMREITTGLETRETIEILEGLSEGERLVVKGHETLRDKSKVRVTE